MDAKALSPKKGKEIKAVILIGGAAKGTRFRPLSLELPKPLFPIAGYLQEFTSLGTAGGIYQFRDQLLAGEPDLLFVMNVDVCCDLPLTEMLEFHSKLGSGDRFVVMATEATRQQSTQFGCVIEHPETHEVLHYVEKPATFVSTLINCGVYLFTPGIFKFIRIAFLEHQQQKCHELRNQCKESIHLEHEIFQPLAGSGTLFVFHTDRFWSQIKFAGAVIYANRHMLALYRQTRPHRLAQMTVSSSVGLFQLGAAAEAGDTELADSEQSRGPIVIGDVFIDPTACVDKEAVVGPNVSIGSRAVIGAGVRLRDCIVLRDAEIRSHACCISAVIGWNVIVGEWARIEGTPNDPNPNKPFTKLDVLPVFNAKGQLNPSITVIGSHVEVPAECMILNSIVLPHKELTHSFKNQIIL